MPSQKRKMKEDSTLSKKRKIEIESKKRKASSDGGSAHKRLKSASMKSKCPSKLQGKKQSGRPCKKPLPCTRSNPINKRTCTPCCSSKAQN